MPISTPDLIAIVATGKTNARSRVWKILSQFEVAGLVKRKGKVKQRNERTTTYKILWGKP